MKYELKNLIVEYNTDIDYIDDIIQYINNNEQKILDFFRIPGLNEKYKIIFLNFEDFRKFIESKYGTYQNYVKADTDAPSKTIRLLTIDDAIKYTKHKDLTKDKFLKTIIHEFVHACHNEILNGIRMPVWIREGLATNLSNQDYHIIDLDCNFDELKKSFRYLKNNYYYAYTLVHYILENYSKDEVYKLISDDVYLKENEDNIFLEVSNNIDISFDKYGNV